MRYSRAASAPNSIDAARDAIIALQGDTGWFPQRLRCHPGEANSALKAAGLPVPSPLRLWGLPVEEDPGVRPGAVVAESPDVDPTAKALNLILGIAGYAVPPIKT